MEEQSEVSRPVESDLPAEQEKPPTESMPSEIQPLPEATNTSEPPVIPVSTSVPADAADSSLPPPSESVPQVQTEEKPSRTSYLVPPDRYSDYSSPDSSRDFPQQEDSCIDRILAARERKESDPELRPNDLYIEPDPAETPPSERFEPVKSYEVPLQARYRVHDRHYCKICQGQRIRSSLGSRSGFIPSIRSSTRPSEMTASLQKCSDCFNRFPWYMETCPYCEVRMTLARVPDGSYKQKVRQWCAI